MPRAQRLAALYAWASVWSRSARLRALSAMGVRARGSSLQLMALALELRLAQLVLPTCAVHAFWADRAAPFAPSISVRVPAQMWARTGPDADDWRVARVPAPMCVSETERRRCDESGCRCGCGKPLQTVAVRRDPHHRTRNTRPARASHTVARACAQVYRPSPSASTEASAAEVVSAIAARLSDAMPTGVLPFERTAAHPAAVVETAFKNYCERLLM